MVLKSQRGQTMVEYILLLAVVLSLVGTFYRSDLFKRLFGKNGLIGATVKSKSEFAYRHAFAIDRQNNSVPTDVPRTNRDISSHPSYATPGTSTSRFFGARNSYP